MFGILSILLLIQLSLEISFSQPINLIVKVPEVGNTADTPNFRGATRFHYYVHSCQPILTEGKEWSLLLTKLKNIFPCNV